jgi:hypothetical protein
MKPVVLPHERTIAYEAIADIYNRMRLPLYPAR